MGALEPLPAWQAIPPEGTAHHQRRGAGTDRSEDPSCGRTRLSRHSLHSNPMRSQEQTWQGIEDSAQTATPRPPKYTPRSAVQWRRGVLTDSHSPRIRERQALTPLTAASTTPPPTLLIERSTRRCAPAVTRASRFTGCTSTRRARASGYEERNMRGWTVGWVGLHIQIRVGRPSYTDSGG
jgi:hypothetical protein